MFFYTFFGPNGCILCHSLFLSRHEGLFCLSPCLVLNLGHYAPNNADIQITDGQNVNGQNVDGQNVDIRITDSQNVDFISPLLTASRRGLGTPTGVK
jgi:hypothetical protein